ncbi:MAG: hypothetical protein CL920_00380 [Deltaproteobacteria bacterium]|nr:hypothetical protein [Deltaproteobacteria bacterium]|tara:strand:+ start:31703 stop:31885 length:183 start_codon:yes stop_codon:yes gene_type:complete
MTKLPVYNQLRDSIDAHTQQEYKWEEDGIYRKNHAMEEWNEVSKTLTVERNIEEDLADLL